MLSSLRPIRRNRISSRPASVSKRQVSLRRTSGIGNGQSSSPSTSVALSSPSFVDAVLGVVSLDEALTVVRVGDRIAGRDDVIAVRTEHAQQRADVGRLGGGRQRIGRGLRRREELLRGGAASQDEQQTERCDEVGQCPCERNGSRASTMIVVSWRPHAVSVRRWPTGTATSRRRHHHGLRRRPPDGVRRRRHYGSAARLTRTAALHALAGADRLRLPPRPNCRGRRRCRAASAPPRAGDFRRRLAAHRHRRQDGCPHPNPDGRPRRGDLRHRVGRQRDRRRPLRDDLRHSARSGPDRARAHRPCRGNRAAPACRPGCCSSRISAGPHRCCSARRDDDRRCAPTLCEVRGGAVEVVDVDVAIGDHVDVVAAPIAVAPDRVAGSQWRRRKRFRLRAARPRM